MCDTKEDPNYEPMSSNGEDSDGSSSLCSKTDCSLNSSTSETSEDEPPQILDFDVLENEVPSPKPQSSPDSTSVEAANANSTAIPATNTNAAHPAGSSAAPCNENVASSSSGATSDLSKYSLLDLYCGTYPGGIASLLSNGKKGETTDCSTRKPTKPSLPLAPKKVDSTLGSGVSDATRTPSHGKDQRSPSVAGNTQVAIANASLAIKLEKKTTGEENKRANDSTVHGKIPKKRKNAPNIKTESDVPKLIVKPVASTSALIQPKVKTTKKNGQPLAKTKAASAKGKDKDKVSKAKLNGVKKERRMAAEANGGSSRKSGLPISAEQQRRIAHRNKRKKAKDTRAYKWKGLENAGHVDDEGNLTSCPKCIDCTHCTL